MYAIIEAGGKQYKVSRDSVIDVEKLGLKPKDEINFDKVLLVANDNEVKVGAPFVLGAKVLAEVVRNFKDKKVIAFKFRRRKSSKSKKGHRQQLSRVKIKEITLA
ncbi:MAG: 50S ribosomal protein L21 [Omnitrophica WOR_2 bacterium RIFCSPHIGHO2_02_FULL_45_21]|nr:MAG: 50S ribosomal protein L21 [Omnitrophica WOR_2 bacterium RIFCSPHIGHO2_02_FULL_45_21]